MEAIIKSSNTGLAEDSVLQGLISPFLKSPGEFLELQHLQQKIFNQVAVQDKCLTPRGITGICSNLFLLASLISTFLPRHDKVDSQPPDFNHLQTT